MVEIEVPEDYILVLRVLTKCLCYLLSEAALPRIWIVEIMEVNGSLCLRSKMKSDDLPMSRCRIPRAESDTMTDIETDSRVYSIRVS